MLDTKSLEDLITAQISSAVDRQVEEIVSDKNFVQGIESRVDAYLQNRILARFNNISTVPEIIDTIKTSVADLVQQGAVPGIGDYVDQHALKQTIDSSIQQLVQGTIDALVLDPEWLSKIETMVNREIARRVLAQLSTVDFSEIVSAQIDGSVARWHDQNRTVGINDTASAAELSVLDGVVVVENDLVSRQLSVEEDAEVKQTLTVKNLAVKGSINTDNPSWNELSDKIKTQCLSEIDQNWRTTMVNEILAVSKTQGIDFASVNIEGRPLLSNGQLHAHVTSSNLQKVGTLSALTVSGECDLTNTVSVRNKRLGINTQEPEMALSLWDEEVSIVAGKLNQQQGFIGTARSQALSIGVNKRSSIEIDEDGAVTLKNLRVGKHRIAFEPQVPGYSGTKGDVVFNSDPRADKPFAWICLGDFKWQALVISK